MKSLVAAVLVCAFASPALGQPITADQFEGNDWWLVQPGGSDSWTVLSSGLPTRSGDNAVLRLVALFAKPRDNGMTGVAMSVIVKCTTRTTSQLEPFILDARGDLKHNTSVVKPSGPIPADSWLFRFACTDERATFRRFQQRDRRSVTAEVLARDPDK